MSNYLDVPNICCTFVSAKAMKPEAQIRNKMKNINGVTLKDVTRIMNVYERKINYFNKKYSFDITKGTTKEQKEYESALNIWDQLKAKRDFLKAA
jgi:hypothetical protein